MGSAILVPKTRELGSVNAVLTAQARRHSVADFPGPLSIKTVLDGRVAWRTEGRDIWVDDSSFLILNDGETYSMDIDAREPVTTCCVFFERGFVESIARHLTHPEELDPPCTSTTPLTFVSRLHPRDERVIPRMRALRQHTLAGASAAEPEKHFLSLARDLLLLYGEMRTQLARVPAARASTRLEILRRVARGREFLHGQVDGPVALKDAARAACLSPYHFHRAFTRIVGETPHSYLTRLRLERAQRLLRTGLPVTEVCCAVGFESLGSFSTLFRKRFGVQPSRFRR